MLNLDFVGARAGARPEGQEPTGARFSYFRGARSQWHGALESYSQIVYRDLWPGIDLVYSGTVNYIGGGSQDFGEGIAVDSSANAYVTGFTKSDQTSFPVTAGPDLTFNGGVQEVAQACAGRRPAPDPCRSVAPGYHRLSGPASGVRRGGGPG